MSIIRYTTPRTFLKYFDLDSIEGGGVNRDLYFSETVNWMDNENWNRPSNRHGREKIIPVIAQKIFETEKFYHYQMNVLGNKITASDAYLKALKEYDDAEIRREIQAEIDGTDEEEAGVTARAGMLIGRIALIHMYSRMSMVLDAVDFNYGLQVVEASIKTAYRFLHEAKKLRSQNSNNNNIDGELKKIAECMKKYSEKNGIIKPSIIADRAFRNQKMGVENFKANYEGKLIAKEWIEIEGNNYRLTDKFRRDNP